MSLFRKTTNDRRPHINSYIKMSAKNDTVKISEFNVCPKCGSQKIAGKDLRFVCLICGTEWNDTKT